MRSRRSIKLPPVQLPTAGIPSISWPNIPTPLKIGGLIAGNIAVDKLREMVERLFAGSADVEQTTLPTNFTIHHSSAAGMDSDVLHVQYNHAIIVGAAALGLALFLFMRHRYAAAIKQSIQDAEAAERGMAQLQGLSKSGIRMSALSGKA